MFYIKRCTVQHYCTATMYIPQTANIQHLDNEVMVKIKNS